MDFLPQGALGVAQGDRILRPVNHLIEAFEEGDRPVLATRDWHPLNHCSFEKQQGPWPPHCVQNTPGAELSPQLRFVKPMTLLAKGTQANKEEYSGFEAKDEQSRTLDEVLKKADVETVYVAGLATDYCVLNTVKDARKLGYNVYVVEDAVAAVNVEPEDERKALEDMKHQGAKMIRSEAVGVHR